jgi:hypothetical protein
MIINLIPFINKEIMTSNIHKEIDNWVQEMEADIKKYYTRSLGYKKIVGFINFH